MVPAVGRHQAPARQAGQGSQAVAHHHQERPLSGKIVDKTFNAGMKMEFETVDNRNLQYSYEDLSDNFVFMDMTTYDQIYIPKTLVGDRGQFLLEEPTASCPSTTAPRCPSNCRLPVILTVTHTEIRFAGQPFNASTKPATVETGAEIQVPLFIGEGEKVKVNTTDGSYLGRENWRVRTKEVSWHVPPLVRGL